MGASSTSLAGSRVVAGDAGPVNLGRAVKRLALWAGVVGPILFVGSFLIEGATRRGYDPVRLQVSYLSVGDQGWIQIANFCVSGVLAIFFAWGLHQAVQSGRGSLLGPLLIAA